MTIPLNQENYVYIPKPYAKKQKEWWLLGAEDGANGELLMNGFRVSVLQDETVMEMDGGDSCTAV